MAPVIHAVTPSRSIPSTSTSVSDGPASMPYDATRAAIPARSTPGHARPTGVSGYRRGDGRCHRRHVRRRGPAPFVGGPGRGRPVGPVVRTVPDARADHRAGRRGHRRGGRPGQGQCRREPGHLGELPGAVDPRRVRAQGRQGGRRVHRRPAGGGGGRVRGQADPGTVRGRPAGGRRGAGRNRGAAPQGPRAPARPSRGHRGAGRHDDRRGRQPTMPSPCSGASPRPRRPGCCWPRPVWPPSRWTWTASTSPTCSTACSTGSATTTTARQEFVDLLETLGPDDPRAASYRKALAARLF